MDYFNWSMLDGVLWLKSIGGECLDDSALHTPIHDHEFNLRHLYLKPNGLMFLQLPLHRNGEKLHKNQKWICIFTGLSFSFDVGMYETKNVSNSSVTDSSVTINFLLA